jgi:hypothetical protein
MNHKIYCHVPLPPRQREQTSGQAFAQSALALLFGVFLGLSYLALLCWAAD